jgi:protein SPT2
LGRKEKAAKLFAQKAKKASGADSVFSVRALVDGRDGAPGYASGSASPSRLPTLAQKHVATGTMKKRGKKGGEVIGQLRKLCPERETRDRRTIDEIQRDIKTRKGILPGDTDRTKSNGQAGDSRSLSPAKILGKPKAPPIPTSARPAPSSSSRLPPSARLPPAHRRRSPSFSSSSSSSPPPPRKRPRSGRSPSIDPLDVSATIQSLFRRPGAPTQRYFDEDEESGGSSDMEAGLSDVEKEEERARRIARKEDEEAEREEREHRLVKERMRKEREREKMKGR